MVVIVVDNQIHIIGDIDDSLSKEFLEKFDFALSFPSKQIELHISSPGGIISDAEDMLDKIRLSYKPVEVYIHNTSEYGKYTGVASIASVIASCASVKTIDYNATFMIHHAKLDGVVQENEEDIIYWMEKTDIDYEIVEHLIKTETKMDADTAKLFGFVDDIKYELYNPPSVKEQQCVECF